MTDVAINIRMRSQQRDRWVETQRQPQKFSHWHRGRHNHSSFAVHNGGMPGAKHQRDNQYSTPLAMDRLPAVSTAESSRVRSRRDGLFPPNTLSLAPARKGNPEVPPPKMNVHIRFPTDRGIEEPPSRPSKAKHAVASERTAELDVRMERKRRRQEEFMERARRPGMLICIGWDASDSSESEVEVSVAAPKSRRAAPTRATPPSAVGERLHAASTNAATRPVTAATPVRATPPATSAARDEHPPTVQSTRSVKRAVSVRPVKISAKALNAALRCPPGCTCGFESESSSESEAEQPAREVVVVEPPTNPLEIVPMPLQRRVFKSGAASSGTRQQPRDVSEEAEAAERVSSGRTGRRRKNIEWTSDGTSDTEIIPAVNTPTAGNDDDWTSDATSSSSSSEDEAHNGSRPRQSSRARFRALMQCARGLDLSHTRTTSSCSQNDDSDGDSVEEVPQPPPVIITVNVEDEDRDDAPAPVPVSQAVPGLTDQTANQTDENADLDRWEAELRALEAAEEAASRASLTSVPRIRGPGRKLVLPSKNDTSSASGNSAHRGPARPAAQPPGSIQSAAGVGWSRRGPLFPVNLPSILQRRDAVQPPQGGGQENKAVALYNVQPMTVAVCSSKRNLKSESSSDSSSDSESDNDKRVVPVNIDSRHHSQGQLALAPIDGASTSVAQVVSRLGPMPDQNGGASGRRNDSKPSVRWSDSEDAALVEAVQDEAFARDGWPGVARKVPGRTSTACHHRYSYLVSTGHVPFVKGRSQRRTHKGYKRMVVETFKAAGTSAMTFAQLCQGVEKLFGSELNRDLKRGSKTTPQWHDTLRTALRGMPTVIRQGRGRSAILTLQT